MALRFAWRASAFATELLPPTVPARGLASCSARAFSSDASPSAPEQEKKQVSGKPDSKEASQEDTLMGLGLALRVRPGQPLTPRQAAHAQPDKVRHKYFLPRLSRKERGSFADSRAEAEFFEESESYPSIPPNVPLYNLREVVPEMMLPRSELLEKIRSVQAAKPSATLDEVLEEVGLAYPGPLPDPAAPPSVLEWKSRLVLAAGVTESHPANWKVRCRVYLRDLQRERELSEAALQHVARVAGQRYDPNTGRLTLTSASYANREDNRREILQMLDALVAEGHRAYPAAATQQQ